MTGKIALEAQQDPPQQVYTLAWGCHQRKPGTVWHRWQSGNGPYESIWGFPLMGLPEMNGL